ncbi:MAG: M28 family peptidase [Gemmatimonadota bacterium]
MMPHRSVLAGTTLALALTATLPACAQTATQTQVARIDRARLLNDLGALAHDSMEGRRIGTPGGERARRFLERRIGELGLGPVPGSAIAQPFTAAGRRGGDPVSGTNLVAMVPGTGPDTARAIVLTAHYDHVGIRTQEAGGDSIYNGADDNASGTAALLALAAHLKENPLRHPVIFAWLDGEEGGLRGARAYVAEPPLPAERMAVNVNLDMVAHAAEELYVAGTHHYPFLLPVVQSVRAQPPVKLIPGHDSGGGSDDWTGQSDHGAFHAAGIPFLYFGVEDHPDYHRPTDHVENITPAFYGAAVETILEVLLELDRQLDGVVPAR